MFMIRTEIENIYKNGDNDPKIDRMIDKKFLA